MKASAQGETINVTNTGRNNIKEYKVVNNNKRPRDNTEIIQIIKYYLLPLKLLSICNNKTII